MNMVHPFRWLILILLLGLGLRITCWNIQDTLYEDSIGYIMDASTLTSDSLLRSQFQEPLHPLILRLAHKIFFPGDVSTNPVNPAAWQTAAFAATLTFSLLSIILIYILGTQLHSKTAGAWAALFTALQPYGIIYAVNGLTESSYIVFFLLALCLALRKSPSLNRLLILAGMSSFLALLIRKDGVILPGIFVVYLLLQKDRSLTNRFLGLLLFFLGFLGGAACYASIGGRFYWLTPYLSSLTAVWRLPIFDRTPLSVLPLATIWGVSHSKIPFLLLAGWFKLSGFIPATLFVLFFLYPRCWSSSRKTLLPLFAFVFQIALVVGFTLKMGYFTTRYLFPAAVVTFPVAGIALAEMLKKIREKYPTWSLTQASLPFALLTLAILIPSVLVSAYHQRRPEILAAAHWIATNSPPDSVLYAGDNRIGFYCLRKNFSVSPLLFRDVMASIHNYRGKNCYLALYFSPSARQTVLQTLSGTAAALNFKPHRIHVIRTPKKEIEIYLLTIPD